MTVEEEQQLTEDGFVRAEVSFDKMAEPACQYLIHTEDGQTFEAMDLPEDFQEDGAKFFMKFQMQRRQSRCSGAQPISISQAVAL